MSENDYYPFGMKMPGRTFNPASGYRYGFNGKEEDDEVKGDGNQQDYGMRIYDTRLAKFLSVDPITNRYPELTPYQFASNTPIWAADLDGAEADFSKTKMEKKEYDPRLPKIWQVETFKHNFSAAAVNTIIQDAEDVVNLFNTKGRKQVTLKVANSVYSMIQFSQLPIDQQWGIIKNHFSEMGNIEDFLGGLAGGAIEGMGISTVSSLAKSLPGVFSKGIGILTMYEGDQIITNALKDGVKVVVATTPDDLNYLKFMGAQALYMEGEGKTGYIIASNVASRPQILEEAIHHQQRLKYGSTYVQDPMNKIKLEIAAQDELLRIGKKENWPASELQEIQRAKDTWEKTLKEIQKKK